MSKLNVEQVKAESGGLRGPLPDDLASADAFLSEAGKVLIKFHGSYEQTNRDKRGPAAKEYAFMVRSKLPGGQLTAPQYLAHDDIATQYGNGSLRITTRQGIQFHGVVKGHLRDTIRDLNHALVTTFGACGDVVRNVMCCPAHTDDPQRLAVQRIASLLSTETLPKTKAYHQIWVDGEPIVADEEDPLYGKTYLPRKFKAAIAFAGDNCMDIFTNDAGLIALFDDDGQLAGFNVVAGGGMGVTHNKEETFARLADVVGFVAPEHAVDVIKAIVTVHRDFGDRTNRRHARLKYVLHEWGLAKFREELQGRVPFPIDPPRPMPPFDVLDHLGWALHGPDTWSLGLPIDSGRIADVGDSRLRSGLREVVSRFGLSVQLTAQQNLLLSGIGTADRDEISRVLQAHGIVTVDQISGLRRNSLACPALPTCGLALGEAERVMPSVTQDVERVLAEVGLPDEPIVFRMTGCPNGCARPYVAEVALVGRSLDKYLLYLGGNIAGTRIARPFLDLLPLGKVAATLKPLLMQFREDRGAGESFGDYCDRVGFDRLASLAGTDHGEVRRVTFYPIYLDLRDRRCLVVGGGPIATGKVRGLTKAGARVTVVAPEAGDDIRGWHGAGAIEWHRRDFVPHDLDNQFLVYAATDDRDLNARIYDLANQAQQVANAVDDLDHCNFIAPAIARQGIVQVAVSTAGSSPALAKQIRDRVQHEVLSPETAGLADFLGRWRPEVKRRINTYERRQSLWEGVLEGCVPALVASAREARADDVMHEYLRRAAQPTNAAARCVVREDRQDVCRACKGV